MYAWIPLDEDEDVSDDKLAEEVDWWSLPGAPVRPEVREAMRMQSVVPAVTVVEDTREDVMQVDAPAETETNGIGGSGMEEVVAAVVSPVVSVREPSPAAVPVVDTEMTDGLSPVYFAALPGSSPSSLHHTPPIATVNTPSPLPAPPTEPVETPKSPSKSPVPPPPPPDPATMEDIFLPSKPSPPSDPLAQAKEVAAGLAIETPIEQAEHATDAGALSGAGGGIAGEGIVGGGTEDLREEEEGQKETGDGQQRTEVEEKILEETKKDMDTEIVKDSVDQ